MGARLEPSTLVGNAYRLDREIGRGGWSVVWAATHMTLQQPRAIKILSAPDEHKRVRFIREARAAAAIEHPNVLPVLDVFETGDTLALVLPLLHGETLYAKLAREDRLTLEETVRLLAPVVSAVARAHEKGIVHRDLKPSNIFLEQTTSGIVPRVLDFGVAKLHHDDDELGLVTRTGVRLGTDGYMAPEQQLGVRDVDGRADVWALGAVLYECLAGFRPVEPGSINEQMYNAFKRRCAIAIQPLGTLAIGLPDDVGALVMGMLAIDREERPELMRVHEVLLNHERASRACRGATKLNSGRPVASSSSLERARFLPPKPAVPLAYPRRLAVITTGMALAVVLAALFGSRGRPTTQGAGAAHENAPATNSAVLLLTDAGSPDPIAASVLEHARQVVIRRRRIGAEFDSVNAQKIDVVEVVHAASSVAGYDKDANWLVPRFRDGPHARAPHLAIAKLGTRSTDAALLRDRDSGLLVQITRQGDATSVAAIDNGYVVYADRAPHVLRTVHHEGIIEHLLFEDAPAAPEVRYSLQLREGSGSLRLVADTLEVLDLLGTPRLRLAPPVVVDAQGHWRPARISVERCVVDTDPRAPWGHTSAPVPATPCDMGIAWDNADLTYPVLVSLTWSATGSPAVARDGETVTRLPDGRYLSAGGWLAAGSELGSDSAELFDPATRTWAATGRLIAARYWHAAAPLADGRVLLLCGSALKSAEIYNPRQGTFRNIAPPPDIRFDPTVTTLRNGDVLVVGGGACDDCAGSAATAVLYHPAHDTWDKSMRLHWPRKRHTATLLGDGTVLVVGSQVYPGSQALARASRSAEIYDPRTSSWSPTRMLSVARYDHAAALLPDGRVLVAGGSNFEFQMQQFLDTTDVYDPTTGQWTPGPKLHLPRFTPLSATLADGRIVITGGSKTLVEVFDPATSTWSPAGHSTVERFWARPIPLGGDEVLVVGHPPPAEVLRLLAAPPLRDE